MKFKHAEWRKLYRDEEGAFARLPWFARAAAAELLKPCDDAGRIDVGEGPPETACARLVATVAFRMGATRGDRRLMATLFPLLFEEGYLVARGRHVVIRNFVAAQRRWDEEEGDDAAPATEPRPTHDGATTRSRTDHDPTATAPRPDREPSTNPPRSSRDASTTEPRPSHDRATKHEPSARNLDGENASARARAHSSVPSSSVPSSSEPEDSAATARPEAEPPPEREHRPTPTEELFAHWCRVMDSPRSKLDAKRRARIEWALKTFGAETCRRAIDGCRADPFSMGENDRQTKFNGLTLIFRDAEHVEKFVALAPARRPPATAPPAPRDPDPETVRRNLEAKQRIAQIAAARRHVDDAPALELPLASGEVERG